MYIKNVHVPPLKIAFAEECKIRWKESIATYLENLSLLQVCQKFAHLKSHENRHNQRWQKERCVAKLQQYVIEVENGNRWRLLVQRFDHDYYGVPKRHFWEQGINHWNGHYFLTNNTCGQNQKYTFIIYVLLRGNQWNKF